MSYTRKDALAALVARHRMTTARAESLMNSARRRGQATRDGVTVTYLRGVRGGCYVATGPGERVSLTVPQAGGPLRLSVGSRGVTAS